MNAINRLRPGKRKLIQLYVALLYNAHLTGFYDGNIYTGPLKNLCVPGLNCYSCPGAIAACPLGSLQNALATSTTRAPAYVLGILVLFGLLLGRTICGFLCPFGLIQELLYKIPTPKLKKNRLTKVLSWFKYVLLITLVIAVPLYYSLEHFPVPAFCKYICPAGTLEGAIGLLANSNNTSLLSMLGILFTRKFVILILILVGAVFIFRIFCRFLCPLGAIYGLFARIALIGVRVDTDRCTGCGICIRECKMDICRVGDHECIHCGACIDSCPVKAIHWQVGAKKIDALKAVSENVLTLKTKPVITDLENALPFKMNSAQTDSENVISMKMNSAPADSENARLVITNSAITDSENARPAITNSAITDSENITLSKEIRSSKIRKISFRNTSLLFLALIVLCGTIWYVNKPTGNVDPQPPKVESEQKLDEEESSETEEKSITIVKHSSGEKSPVTPHSEQSPDIKGTSQSDSATGSTNGNSSANNSNTGNSTISEVGFEVGMHLPDFTVPIYGGGTWSSEEQRGKVTVINFWATWCTPCVNELQYFEKLSAEHPDTVSVVAIHSNLITEDVDQWLARENYNLTFALDETGDVITSLGGSTMLPMTVITDVEGIITYNAVGSVDWEKLESLVSEVLNGQK